jgi:hypothetical protein
VRDCVCSEEEECADVRSWIDDEHNRSTKAAILAASDRSGASECACVVLEDVVAVDSRDQVKEDLCDDEPYPSETSGIDAV